MIKVSDYGLECKLDELLQSCNGSPDVADKFAPSIGRGGKKGDIYRVGILVLSLVKGYYVTQNPPPLPDTLPTQLKHFLLQ